MIALERITHRYGGTTAVDDVTLEVAAGELVAIVGESGCGKTTTLKIVNRLIEPSAGSVRIDGVDAASLAPHELRRRIGYVFQRIGLFPHMTVAENVAITPELLGWEARRVRERVDELLALVELEPEAVRARRPQELSGGQQQRVALARALAAEPRIVLLDEPFGALDPLTRDRLHEVFGQIRRRLSLTALLVSHDMGEALLLADRIVVMREGRVVQLGSPADLLAAPADDYVRGLLDTPMRHWERISALVAAGDAR